MKQSAAILAIVLVISACQTTRTRFDEAAYSGFDKYTLTWSNGNESALYLRTANRNGHLAVCSYVISEDSPGDRDTEMAWYRVQTLYIEGQSVGSYDFLRIYGKEDFAPFQAGCIETTTPWSDAYAYPDINLDGASRIVVKY